MASELNKTIEAIEALRDGDILLDEGQLGAGGVITTEALKALASAVKWMPVSEKPKESNNYLVTLGDETVEWSWWSAERQEWSFHNVIAWRERPEPHRSK
jgi:hypothetical protein